MAAIGVTFASLNTSVGDIIEREKSSFFPVFVTQIAFGAMAIVVNLLVLCVLVIGKLHNSLSYMLCNLAVANMLLGVALSTRAAIEIMDENIGYTVQFVCHLTLMIAIMNMGTCITTIFCLCLNMYLSIGYPMHFSSGISRKKTALFLSFWWMFWLGYALAIFAASTNSADSVESFSCNFASGRYHRNYVATFVGLSLVISGLTIFFQYKTISVIRVQMIKMTPSNDQSVTNSSDAGDFLATTKVVSSLASAQRLHHMSITVALILGLYILCWGTFMLTHFIVNVCPDQCSISDNTVVSVSTLPIIHNIFNIFIYLYRSKEFRSNLFGRVFKQLTRSHGASSRDPNLTNVTKPSQQIATIHSGTSFAEQPYLGPEDGGIL